MPRTPLWVWILLIVSSKSFACKKNSFLKHFILKTFFTPQQSKKNDCAGKIKASTKGKTKKYIYCFSYA